VLIFIQCFQSFLVTCISIKICKELTSSKDIIMNFTALAVVRELDDYVGKWYLTTKVRLKGMLTFKVEELS